MNTNIEYVPPSQSEEIAQTIEEVACLERSTFDIDVSTILLTTLYDLRRLESRVSRASSSSGETP